MPLWGLKTLVPALLLCVASSSAYALFVHGRAIWVPTYQKIIGQRSVADVLRTYGPAVRPKLRRHFAAAGVAYPAQRLTFLAVKNAATLEVWAENDGLASFITSYDIHKLSGQAGPKLREGDRQVPEGIYRISALNPNSSYHLSMKLDYPNAFDQQHARAEGRTQPGSNIFIHGKAVSIGCLAMGDAGIEELFVLVADTGYHNVSVVIAPQDPRQRPLTSNGNRLWIPQLYRDITRAFNQFSTRT